MTHSIKHLFHINAKRGDVFKAISTIGGLAKWWTTKTSGSADKGGIIQCRFGDIGPDMEVIELKKMKALPVNAWQVPMVGWATLSR